MKEPVDHILRPQLPWRTDSRITECGLNAANVPTLTRAQFAQRRKDMGDQRTALFTCMTCSNAASRWGTWGDDPRAALEREIIWETSWRRTDHGCRLRDELLAIAALIEAHPVEFAAHVSATEQRREWLARKAARADSVAAKPKFSGGL